MSIPGIYVFNVDGNTAGDIERPAHALRVEHLTADGRQLGGRPGNKRHRYFLPDGTAWRGELITLTLTCEVWHANIARCWVSMAGYPFTQRRRTSWGYARAWATGFASGAFSRGLGSWMRSDTGNYQGVASWSRQPYVYWGRFAVHSLRHGWPSW